MRIPPIWVSMAFNAIMLLSAIVGAWGLSGLEMFDPMTRGFLMGFLVGGSLAGCIVQTLWERSLRKIEASIKRLEHLVGRTP